MKVFDRAIAANNPKHLYMKLIEMYKRTKKWEMVEELAKTMVKRFKRSSKCWIFYLENMLEVRRNENPPSTNLKDIVERSLKSVHKRKYYIILSHHALLLYKYQEVEQGRTTFEAILTNYPQRTDIWSMYIDMEIKHGDQESVRNLLDRCLTLKVNAKK